MGQTHRRPIENDLALQQYFPNEAAYSRRHRPEAPSRVRLCSPYGADHLGETEPKQQCRGANQRGKDRHFRQRGPHCSLIRLAFIGELISGFATMASRRAFLFCESSYPEPQVLSARTCATGCWQKVTPSSG